MMKHSIHSQYFKQALDPSKRSLIINAVVKSLKGVKFDSVVCRGMSGMVIAPLVAHKMKKGLTFVRKSDNSHSEYDVEGVLAKKYVIIDDFIGTGDTIDEINRRLDKFNREYNISMNIVRIVLYSGASGGYSDSDYNGIPIIRLNQHSEFNVFERVVHKDCEH